MTVVRVEEWAPAPSEYDRDEVECLSRELREHAAHLAAAECRWLERLARFDGIRGWAVEGCRSAIQWLGWACGMGSVAARERLRVAHALEELPRVSESFAAGRLSYSKVRAITRVATSETEEVLVMWAECATAAQLERIVRGYRSAKRAADPEEDSRRYEDRYLRWSFEEDGALRIEARLPAEEGAMVLRALEQVAEHAGEPPPSEDAPPVAAARDAREGAGPTQFRNVGELPELTAYTGDVNSLWPTRYADALRVLAETVLASGPHAQPGGDRYQVVVHADAASVADPEGGEAGRIEDGGTVCPQTVRRMLCDASVQWVVRGTDGTPLDLGRKTRRINRALRRALKLRDGGCMFPSCTARRFVDAHHIEAWVDGGETRLSNLVLVCRFHHRLLHEGSYEMRIARDGRFRFFRPSGEEIPDHPPPVSGEADRVADTSRLLGVEIGPDTPVTQHYTHRPNYNDAVTGLFMLNHGGRGSSGNN